MRGKEGRRDGWDRREGEREVGRGKMKGKEGRRNGGEGQEREPPQDISYW